MPVKMLRKLINIDEALCNGCGICLSSCDNGALVLSEGKASLLSELYCDGLAACLKKCPEGALSIRERNAESFDRVAVDKHLREMEDKAGGIAGSSPASTLDHWPVHLALVPTGAEFLMGSDLVLVADCVPLVYPALHADFLRDHIPLVACPRLDDVDAHFIRLAEILKKCGIRSITVVQMDIPPCSGLIDIAHKAIQISGKEIPLKGVKININGCIIS
ncbi:MAG: 4Fe-4S binding protein [Dehalococcoidales bacterium]|nr:4Fe-4S binding protein [Dehalococcoidales bacterium]